MSSAAAARIGPATRVARTSRTTSPACGRLRLGRELDAAQVAGTDLVRPAGYLPVEGGGAAQGEGHGRALAQRDLGAQGVSIGAAGHEPDAGDVLERNPQATAAEVALERGAAAAAHVVGGHLRPVDVGEGGVEIANRRARGTAAQRSQAEEGRAEQRDDEGACGAPPQPPAHASLPSVLARLPGGPVGAVLENDPLLAEASADGVGLLEVAPLASRVALGD